MRKYFHLYADGKTVKEITKDEWYNIIIKQRKWGNRKLVATVYGNEITLNKGINYIFILRNQLDEILKES